MEQAADTEKTLALQRRAVRIVTVLPHRGDCRTAFGALKIMAFPNNPYKNVLTVIFTTIALITGPPVQVRSKWVKLLRHKIVR